MNTDRKASFYVGLGASILVTSAVLTSCGSEPAPVATVNTQEQTCPPIVEGELNSPISIDRLRQDSVWNVLPDHGYQWLLDRDCRSASAIKQESNTITLRIKRSAMPFAESFDKSSPLAYMYNVDDEIYRGISAELMDKILNTKLGNGVVLRNGSTPSLVVTNEVTKDKNYVYIIFPGIPDNNNYWEIILRRQLFKDTSRNPEDQDMVGVRILYHVHFIPKGY